MVTDIGRVTHAPRRAHLVGVAGSGMSALACVLADWGWQLSGSDLVLEGTRALAARGVRLTQGHAATHVPADAELVIHSDAVPDDNPELARARQLGIRTCRYFELLGRLTAELQTLAVAGTHGKSTTTAMAGRILVEAGLDPTVFCGAVPVGESGGGRAGRGDLAVVEACEYRANFLHLRPHSASILGIEPDHFDCYQGLAEIQKAFARFAASVGPDGRLLVRHECPAARTAALGATCRVETFGLEPQADWSARPVEVRHGRHTFEVFHADRRLAEVRLQVPGLHNVVNALAALALSSEYGVPAERAAAALARFPGLRRRLERLGRRGGVELLDDYAHHPTEVTASLAATRQMYPGRRMWCVFQPHQESRTRRLLDELAASLDNTDNVLVAEIFRAREPAPRPGDVTAADLARKVRGRGNPVPQLHAMDEIAEHLARHLLPGDVLLTVGAGDIRQVHDRLRAKASEMAERAQRAGRRE